jgi:TPR repeat protein
LVRLAFIVFAFISLEWTLGLAAAHNALAESQPPPQDAPVTDCDNYAADPIDPERKSIGIFDENLNPSLAIPACENAVRQHPNSKRLIFQLGRAYQKKGDFSSALVQHRKAADHGYLPAQFALGVMYQNGQGVAQNSVKAVEWWRKAAANGHAKSQEVLGVLYSLGAVVRRNDAEAVVKWLHKAADQGLATSQVSLGKIYQTGRGVAQNDVEALNWYRKAADQGNATAQNELGVMYVKGQGVPRNYVDAMKWFRKAADQGDADAKDNLKLAEANVEAEKPKQEQPVELQAEAPGRQQEQQLPVLAEDQGTSPSERLKSYADKYHPSFLEAGIFFMTGEEPPGRVKFQVRPDSVVSAAVKRLMLEPGRAAYEAIWEFKLSPDKPCTIMGYKIQPPYAIERLEFLNVPSPRAMRTDPKFSPIYADVMDFPPETWCHAKAYCRTTANLDFRVVQIVVAYAIAKHPRTVLLDHDWARFQQLVREWHVERGTTSSPIDMATCPAYQRILAMGKPAISLILKQLELEGDDPDHWFWALSYLTGEDPVPSDDQGNMRKMSDAWLRWGRNNLHV